MRCKSLKKFTWFLWLLVHFLFICNMLPLRKKWACRYGIGCLQHLPVPSWESVVFPWSSSKECMPMALPPSVAKKPVYNSRIGVACSNFFFFLFNLHKSYPKASFFIFQFHIVKLYETFGLLLHWIDYRAAYFFTSASFNNLSASFDHDLIDKRLYCFTIFIIYSSVYPYLFIIRWLYLMFLLFQIYNIFFNFMEWNSHFLNIVLVSSLISITVVWDHSFHYIA